MSIEEDIELRDLVAQTLEANGCLAKIRAQLRASMFLALDDDIKTSCQQPLLNNKVKTCLETAEGKVMFAIVREFLEFYNLHFTISVYEPESYLDNGYEYKDRQTLAKELGLDGLEDASDPLLLHLIRPAQTKAKSIEINLNLNGNEDNKSSSQNSDSTSNIKTEPNSLNGKDNRVSSEDEKRDEENGCRHDNFNATYDLSSPTVSLNMPSKKFVSEEKQALDSTFSKKESKDDDTYEDTSSIAEDAVDLNNLEKNSLDNSTKFEVYVNGLEEKMPLETTKETESSQPLKKAEGKSKLPPKPDKLKTKSSLSCLSDLPPLNSNKSLVNDILPSLYSKEFKEKSNLRELDKLFDMEAEYEEDFMCSGDDLSLKSDYLKSNHSRINLLEDISVNKAPNTEKCPILGKRDSKQNKIPNRIISDCNKPLFKPLVNIDAIKNNDSEKSSISSISEMLSDNE